MYANAWICHAIGTYMYVLFPLMCHCLWHYKVSSILKINWDSNDPNDNSKTKTSCDWDTVYRNFHLTLSSYEAKGIMFFIVKAGFFECPKRPTCLSCTPSGAHKGKGKALNGMEQHLSTFKAGVLKHLLIIRHSTGNTLGDHKQNAVL